MRFFYCIILFLCCCGWHTLRAQDTAMRKLAGTSLFNTDTSRTKQPVRLERPPLETYKTPHKDSIPVVIKRTPHDPNKATIRSAMIPGWGQIYNREYWKLPLVYGALAIPTATFFFNNSYYKKTKFAYEAVYAASTLINGVRDSTMYREISKDVLSSNGTPYSLSVYQSARNSYRQNRDYSVLWFLILWGVNVVDATVFGHLQTFDVSDDLSMQVRPTFNTALRAPGIGLVFSLKKPTPRSTLSAAR